MKLTSIVAFQIIFLDTNPERNFLFLIKIRPRFICLCFPPLEEEVTISSGTYLLLLNLDVNLRAATFAPKLTCLDGNTV